MSMKRFLVAASASLAGLMMLVCTWSSASAAGQVMYFCNINPTAVAAKSSTAVTCASSTLQAFMTDFNTAYATADVSADNPAITINSIEAFIQAFGAGDPLDFVDIAFTPYVDTVGGGGISGNNTTYGGFNSPNIDICKTTIPVWLKSAPFSGSPPFTFQYQLTVFATNSDTKTHFVSGTLHVITNFDQGLCM